MGGKKKPINYDFIFLKRILLSREKCLSVFAAVVPVKGLDDSRAHQCGLRIIGLVFWGVNYLKQKKGKKQQLSSRAEMDKPEQKLS